MDIFYMWVVWLGLLLFFFFKVFNRCKRLEGHNPRIAKYEPPTDINPMFCGFLLDKRLHVRDILAGIIFLHQKNIIDFDKESPRKMLFNQKEIEKAESEITEMVFAKGYVQPASLLNTMIYVLALLFFVGSGLFILLHQIKMGMINFSWFEKYIYVISLPVFIWLAYAIHSNVMVYTKKGLQVRNSISGFKKYLSIAEKERLVFHNSIQEQPESFDYYLAYAIALGIDIAWFSEYTFLMREPPDWYHITFFATLPAVIYKGNKLSLPEIVTLVEYYS